MINGFEKLTIQNKQEYDYYLKQTDGFIPSSHYFCEALVWDFSFEKYYKIIQGYLCIMVYVKAKDKITFMPPMGKYKKETFEKVIFTLYEQLEETNRKLYFIEVSEQMKNRIDQVDGLHKNILYNRECSEYTYDIEEFKNTFHKKSVRYAVNHFQKNHETVVHKINADNVHNCNEIVKFYCDSHNCIECTCGCELDVTKNVAENFPKLGLKGILLEIDNEMSAFAITEKLNHDLCVHFKKHKHRIRGINEIMHKKILEMYENKEEIKSINYTDDMGIPGLRQYKSALCPYDLQSIYEISVTLSTVED